eukprot:SAG31_NODE_276_length_18650_cov_5.821842_9_plen_91_part_00
MLFCCFNLFFVGAVDAFAFFLEALFEDAAEPPSTFAFFAAFFLRFYMVLLLLADIGAATMVEVEQSSGKGITFVASVGFLRFSACLVASR